MEHEDPVPVEEQYEPPGVVFWLERASRSTSVVHKAKGIVTLTADISDEELWDDVVKKLNGYCIYGPDDFYQQLMTALRNENMRLTAELDRTKEKLRVELEQERHKVAMLSDELKRARTELQVHRGDLEQLLLQATS